MRFPRSSRERPDWGGRAKMRGFGIARSKPREGRSQVKSGLDKAVSSDGGRGSANFFTARPLFTRFRVSEEFHEPSAATDGDGSRSRAIR